MRGPDAPSRRWYERRWLQVAASLLLVVWMLSAIDFDRARFLESAREVEWWPIVIALLLRPVAVWARAWQAAVLLQSADIALSVRDVWRAFMFGEMLSRFVPGNLGTMAHVAQLSNRLREAFVAQLLDRIFFLMLALWIAALSLFGAGRGLPALLAAGALIGVMLAAYVVYRGMLRWVPLSPGHRGTIERVLQRRDRWASAYLLASILSLALTTVLFGLLVVACAGKIHVFELVAAVTLVTIGAAMPFTINGVGVREWVFLALLKETLPSSEAIVTLAAMTYALGFASALVGVATWVVLGRKVTSGDAEG